MNDIDAFIIAGGKCGSSTLKKTFSSLELKTIKSHNPTCFKNQFGYEGFFDTIIESSKYKRLIIVDAYRTPIERKISSFFHNGERKIPNFLNMTIKEQIDLFNKDYLYRIEEQHIINDIYTRLNIPQYAQYDARRRYLHQNYKNIKIIKLHYSDINNWDIRLTEIFRRPIKIIPDNISKNKSYYDTYKNFLEQYKVPIHYIEDKLSKDIEFKKYQTPAQQNAYIKMWLKKSV